MNLPFDAEIVLGSRQKKIGHLVEPIMLIFTLCVFATGNYEAQPVKKSSDFPRRASRIALEFHFQMFRNMVVDPGEQFAPVHQPVGPSKCTEQLIHLRALVLVLGDKVLDALCAVLAPHLVDAFLGDAV